MRVLALLFAVAISCTAGAFAQTTAKGSVVLAELSKPVYPPLAHQAKHLRGCHRGCGGSSRRQTKIAFESGHLTFKPAALDSARKSRFECRKCDSTVTYRLTYSFRLSEGSDCYMSPPVRVTLEPPSGEQNMTQCVTITADHICLCDASI